MVTFLVYLALSQLLFVITFRYSSSVFIYLSAAGRANNSFSELNAAHDCFSYDVRMAPSEKKMWKKITNHELIWSSSRADVGWVMKENMLMRIEGAFNDKSNTWHDKTVSVVARNINDLIFHVDSNGTYVFAVTIECDTLVNGKRYAIDRSITLRNRVIA